MNFSSGFSALVPGAWYLTRSGLSVKVIVVDLPSDTGHSVIAIQYLPTSWALQTYLATGRLSATTDMPQDLIAETHPPATLTQSDSESDFTLMENNDEPIGN